MIDDLGFRVEFLGLGFQFRNSIIRKKLKKLFFIFSEFYLFKYLFTIYKKQVHMSLLPLNEEDIFENVPLVVVKMKSGSMKVVSM